MEPEHLSDQELLARYIEDGDRSALEVLVYRYQRLVWSVCSRAVANRADAEDAFQMTFLILSEKAGRIRKRNSLSNWLYGVARRVSSDIRRRRAATVTGPIEDLVVDQETVLHAISRQHEIDLVDQQLQAMPESHRTPLVLRYFSGLTAKEIADQLDVSVAAAEGRLRRARQQLKRMLIRAGWNDPDQRNAQNASFGCIGLLAAPGFRSEVTGGTLSKLAATVEGIQRGFHTGQFSMGTKLMICKFACATGIAAVMAVVAHHAPLDDTVQVEPVVVVAAATQEAAVDSPVVDFEASPSELPCCIGYELCTHLSERLAAICEYCPLGCCDELLPLLE